MPTYDYVCSACGHEWELFQSIMADPEKKCPECKKKKAERQIGTGAGLIFKGSGFYETDYRSDSYNKAAAADSKSSESSSDSKATESKSDSKSSDSGSAKSETKSDSKPSSKSD